MYALVLWTIVGFTSPATYSDRERHDWRVLTDGHQTEQSCHDAARALNIKTERYRCIKK